MSIQQMFLGSGTGTVITAQDVFVSEIRSGPVTVSATFGSNGRQITTINGSDTVVGNWVSPDITADQWEIRATLSGGATPSGTLGTWLPLTTTRTWSLSISVPGSSSESILVFEFRKVGGSSAEVTLAPSTLSAEVLDTF